MTMPGDRRIVFDVEVVAVSDDHGESCEVCEFVGRLRCASDESDCTNPAIHWLTPLNYIAHRLTQGNQP